MDKLVNFFKHYKRPIIWVTGALGLYGVLGFLLVPYLAEKQLLKILEQRLSVKASVESLRFNPFSFSTQITQLNLESEQGNPLIAVDSIYINLDPSKLLLLEINLADVIIDAPQIHFIRVSSSENTISRLLKKWQESTPVGDTESPEPPSGDEPLLAFEITNLDYHNGSIHYRDEVPKPAFETILSPINIQVNELSTEKKEQQGNNLLIIHLEKDAVLSFNNQFTLAPIKFNGHINLENFSLLTPYRYFQESLPFNIHDGRLSLSLDYQFHIEHKSPRLTIENVALQLSGLDATSSETETRLIHGGTLSLMNGRFTYPEQTLTAGSVDLDGFNVYLQRDKQGLINWQQMFQAFKTSSDPDSLGVEVVVEDKIAVAAETKPAVNLAIQYFIIRNTTATFEDNFLSNPGSISINLAAALEDLTLAPESKMPFSSKIRLTTGGDIALQGNLQIMPDLHVSTHLSINALSLQPVQAYLDELALIDIADGLISTEATLATGKDELFAYQGNIGVNNLLLNDRQQNQRLLSLDSLSINNLDFSLSQQDVSASEIIVDQLYGRMIINKGGETNISRTFIDKNTASKEAPNTTTAQQATQQHAPAKSDEEQLAESFKLQLGQVKVINASASFTDYNLPIVFNTEMQTLNGDFSGFSSESTQPMEINLEGKVDKFGLVEITGDLNPLNITDNTEIDLGFTNLELTAITPYSMKFAGRKIDKGRADIDLQYRINNAKLKASNNLVIRDIELGEQFNSDDAPSLPLDLVIALLKNNNGVIDLDIPVSGDVNNPEFNLGPAIRQALFNIITGIVTSPFKLLGKLAGGEHEELDNIRFRPGRTDLSPPELEKLLSLATALEKRPQLILQVPAPLAESADKKALQKQLLKTRVEAELGHKGTEAKQLKQRMHVLEDFYSEAELSPSLDQLRKTFTTVATDNNPPSFDTLAYNNALRNALIPTQQLTEDQLTELAKQRQALVVEYMQTQGKLGANRIQLQPVTTSKVKDQWLIMVLAVDIRS